MAGNTRICRWAKMALCQAVLLAAVCQTGCDRSSKKHAAAPSKQSTPPPVAATPIPATPADRYRALWASWPADWTSNAAFLMNDSAIPRMDQSPEALAGGATGWAVLSQSLKDHEKEIKELVAIASKPRCDLALQPSDDLDSEFMRAGGKFRIAWRLLRADAARCWQGGDMDGCVDRLAAAFGLVDHLGQQKSLMMSLVGTALAVNTCDAVNVFIKDSPAGAFKPVHAAKLLGAISRLNAEDPAGIAAAVKAEPSVDPVVSANIETAQDRSRAALNETRELLVKHNK